MTITMLSIIVWALGVFVLVLANYVLILRSLVFRLDDKLAEMLENDPRYVRISKESRDLAKRLGVDLFVKDP